MLLRSRAEEVFNAVEEAGEEFLTVALNSDVGRLPVLFKRVNELSRVVRIPVRHFQKAKEPLKLNEQIIVDLAPFPLACNYLRCVHRLQHQVPELGHHKNLLQHGDHVANAS